jgi:tetratricopeptide (TPR) repeat protein
MGRQTWRSLALAGLALVTASCATAPPPAPSAPPPPTATPGPPVPPPPVAPTPTPAPTPLPPVVVEPTPLERLGASYRTQARELERAGRLRRALDAWKLALTIKPDDAEALEGRRALEARIESTLADRMRLGREALAKDDHLEARRQFLAALALDPTNAGAFEALQRQVRELRFRSHTVRRGETLATIAERYYGDRSRAEVVWELNQLPPNPRLAPGMVLRIPEIPGVPFVDPEARVAVRPPETPAAPSGPGAPPAPPGGPAAPAPPTVETPKSEDGVQISPYLVSAREAFEKGEFQVALADIDRALTANHGPDGMDLKKAILYGLGRNQFNQRRWDESYKTLTQLVSLQPDYRDTATLLRQTRERLVQDHYSQGLRLFQQEQLEAAIKEWRIVLDFDPQHANAKKNIEQAERLLQALRQRQQRR